MSSHVYIIIVFFDTILHEERRNILNGCLLGLNWVGFKINLCPFFQKKKKKEKTLKK